MLMDPCARMRKYFISMKIGFASAGFKSIHSFPSIEIALRNHKIHNGLCSFMTFPAKREHFGTSLAFPGTREFLNR